MNRKEFIKLSALFGIGGPLLANSLISCSTENDIFPSIDKNFNGKVAILGAGAAGMAASYLLKREGIDFDLIEANSNYGGRVKRTNNLADFPIDLGAEWIHTSPNVLANIINDSSVSSSIETIVYNPQDIQVWNNDSTKRHRYGSNFYSEHKFKSTSWFGFFEQFIVPSIKDNLHLNSPISRIEYDGNGVTLTSNSSKIFTADRLIITAPIKVLQDQIIEFFPALPSDYKNAIDSIYVGDGFKAFIEFDEQFYPDIMMTGGLIESFASSDKMFYNAAFRKDTTKHVMGLFSVNNPASKYAQQPTNEESFNVIMQELDQIFDGKASQHYQNHVIQNWSKEPYIRGAYSYTFNNDRSETQNTLNTPINDKLYFAGEALSDWNQSTVHGACESGMAAAAKVLSSNP
ncbi:MAG: FAD-dependent oxidoreductase [Bacteroidia bacterium]